MEGPHGNILYNILVLIAWTVTSFLCHQFGKTFLNQFTGATFESVNLFHVIDNGLLFGQILPALLLTGVQLVFCATFISAGDEQSTSLSRMAKWCHALATLATNISMALMASSSTFAIKMMEPVTSAVVQYLRVGALISPLSVASLPLIVGGAIAFVGNPFENLGTAPGTACALASNIILAFRNMEIKNMIKNSNTPPLRLKHGLSAMTLRVLAIMFMLSGCSVFEIVGVFPPHSTITVLFLHGSATFHVVYSYVSTALVLSAISVVSHAVANIMKRLLVVLLLYTFGKRVAAIWNFTGLLVCTAGLLVYAWDKTRKRESSVESFITETSGIITSRENSRIGVGTRRILIGMTAIGLLLVVSPSLHKHQGDFEPKHIFSESSSLVDGVNAVGVHRFIKPNVTQILDNITGIPKESVEILKLQSEENVTSVGLLSQQLPTSNEVIAEAQRLHYELIGKDLQRFKYAFLFDLNVFENKGDPAIAVGEIYFLSRMNIEIVYHCSGSGSSCSKNLDKAKKLATKYNPDELVILMSGGGNIITYPSYDVFRFKVVSSFSAYKMFIFPQSIWVRNWNSPHVRLAQKNYCCHPNLTIILRDLLSYSVAKKLFNGSTRLIVVPDMAFEIGHVPRFMSPVFDIMWVKRGDGETPGYSLPKEIPHNLRVHASDWITWPTPKAKTDIEWAFYIATNGFFFLQRGRVVITDRLHGHILSVLLDIPHVLIDNKGKKLSSYHNSWTRSLENTVITDDPSKALGLAIELLKKYNDTLPAIVPFQDVRADLSQAPKGVLFKSLP